MIDVLCRCGNVFEARDDLAGGITNCPSCGKAVEVPGLRDPLWRLHQVVGVIVWIGITVGAYALGGVLAAIAAAVVTAGLLWLASRAL